MTPKKQRKLGFLEQRSKAKPPNCDAMSSQFTTWIAESKQSLSIAGPICNEANELLSQTRGRIERASVLWAQTVYLRTVISGQFETLKSLEEACGAGERRCLKDFTVSKQ